MKTNKGTYSDVFWEKKLFLKYLENFYKVFEVLLIPSMFLN